MGVEVIACCSMRKIFEFLTMQIRDRILWKYCNNTIARIIELQLCCYTLLLFMTCLLNCKLWPTRATAKLVVNSKRLMA